jgi:hypothetical protein
MTEVRRTSNEEILHKHLLLPDQPSVPGKCIKCKTSPRRDEHFREGMKTFSTNNIGKNLWSTYPCVSCGTSNHSVGKC